MANKANENDMGAAISNMLVYAEKYAEAYRKNFESPIGDDYVLGDDGMRDIMRGLNNLLNGPLGRYNGGELSGLLHDAAARMGLTDENGEF